MHELAIIFGIKKIKKTINLQFWSEMKALMFASAKGKGQSPVFQVIWNIFEKTEFICWQNWIIYSMQYFLYLLFHYGRYFIFTIIQNIGSLRPYYNKCFLFLCSLANTSNPHGQISPKTHFIPMALIILHSQYASNSPVALNQLSFSHEQLMQIFYVCFFHAQLIFQQHQLFGQFDVCSVWGHLQRAVVNQKEVQ